MKTVNMHEAKTHLSRLVEGVEKGEPFIIARAGKPVVKVTLEAAAISSAHVMRDAAQNAIAATPSRTAITPRRRPRPPPRWSATASSEGSSPGFVVSPGSVIGRHPLVTSSRRRRWP